MTIEFLSLQKSVFKLLGQSCTTNKYNTALKVLIIFNIIVSSLIMIGTGAYAVENIDDIDMVTDALAPVFTGVLTLIKGITFVLNKMYFINVMNAIEKMIGQCKKNCFIFICI